MSMQMDLIDYPGQTIASVSASIGMSEIAEFFDNAYGRIATAVSQQGVVLTGPALALYRRPPSDTLELEAAFPTDRLIDPDGDIQPSSLPAGRTAHAVYQGGYDGLADAWGTLIGWVLDQGLEPTGVSWEVYVTEPSPTMDPSVLITELFCQLRQD